MYYYSGAQIEEKKQRRKYSGSVPLTIISDLLNEQKLSFLNIRAFNQIYKPFKKNRYFLKDIHHFLPITRSSQFFF